MSGARRSASIESRSIASSDCRPDLVRRTARRTTSRARARASAASVAALADAARCARAARPRARATRAGSASALVAGVAIAVELDLGSLRAAALGELPLDGVAEHERPAAARPPSRSRSRTRGASRRGRRARLRAASGDDVRHALRDGVVDERALRPPAEHLLPGGEALGAPDDARQRVRAAEERAVVVRDLEARRHARHHGVLGRDGLGAEHADARRAQAPLLAALVPDRRAGAGTSPPAPGRARRSSSATRGGVVAPGAAADVHPAGLDVLAHARARRRGRAARSGRTSRGSRRPA